MEINLMYPRLPSISAAQATLNFRFPCLHLPGTRKRAACYQPSLTPGWEWKPGLFACLASTHRMELHPKSLSECSLDLKIQLQIKYWGQKKIMLFFPHKFIPFWEKEICGSTDASSGSMALFFHFYYEEIRLLIKQAGWRRLVKCQRAWQDLNSRLINTFHLKKIREFLL